MTLFWKFSPFLTYRHYTADNWRMIDYQILSAEDSVGADMSPALGESHAA